jgi:hypothetical protein
MRLEVKPNFSLVGSITVVDAETMTFELDPIDSAGNSIAYDDGGPMAFTGQCSLKRDDQTRLICKIFKNNGLDFEFNAEMDLVSRGVLEGSHAFEGETEKRLVTLRNPREAVVN